MTRLILEAALLLLGAYFLGAWVACLVKRTFFATAKGAMSGNNLEPVTITARAPSSTPSSPIAPPVRRPDPKPIALETIERGPPQAAADAAHRFEKVLSQAPTAAAAAAATVAATVAKAATAPAPTPAAPPVNRVAPAAPAAPVLQTPVSPVVVQSAVAPKIVIPNIVAPPVVAPSVAVPGVVAPLAPLAAATAANDDLTRIRAIDTALQARLIKLGAGRYRDIAGWRTADVARVSQALGFTGRIEQENWIEQAQILARGGETAYSRRRDRGELAQSTTVAPSVNQSAPSGTPQPTVASVASVPQTGAPSPATTPRVADRAAFAQKPATTIPAPILQQPVRSVANVAPTISVPGLAAAAASAAAAGLGSAAASLGRDDLQRIGGINAEVEKLLNVQGVTRYAQVSSWSSDDAMRFDRLLGHEGRVRRENWIEQAQMLARGGDTAYSRQFDQRRASGSGSGVASDTPRPSRLADAIRDVATKTGAEISAAPARSSDMSGMRSVRSEAYTSKNQPTGTPDDLKRVRGVGVLIEKKLISMGVTSYQQIANWSASDIDRVSQVLDFRGRIERENWVEQARILSAGGQTEFSRRVDRGEVETSKNR